MKIRCDKCKYEWETNSKLIWITCPSCRLKVKSNNQDMKGGSNRQNEKNTR